MRRAAEEQVQVAQKERVRRETSDWTQELRPRGPLSHASPSEHKCRPRVERLRGGVRCELCRPSLGCLQEPAFGGPSLGHHRARLCAATTGKATRMGTIFMLSS